MKVKYGEYIIIVSQSATGHKFECPICGDWIDVDGHIIHCLNRIHQHLYLQHKYGPYSVEEIK